MNGFEKIRERDALAARELARTRKPVPPKTQINIDTKAIVQYVLEKERERHAELTRAAEKAFRDTPKTVGLPPSKPKNIPGL